MICRLIFFYSPFFVLIKPLTDLEHLNLAYNNLQKTPVLGLSAQAKLTTLIIRNNELETVNGEFSVQQLYALYSLQNVFLC